VDEPNTHPEYRPIVNVKEARPDFLANHRNGTLFGGLEKNWEDFTELKLF
jgi:hypothetical protein